MDYATNLQEYLDAGYPTALAIEEADEDYETYIDDGCLEAELANERAYESPFGAN